MQERQVKPAEDSDNAGRKFSSSGHPPHDFPVTICRDATTDLWKITSPDTIRSTKLQPHDPEIMLYPDVETGCSGSVGVEELQLLPSGKRRRSGVPRVYTDSRIQSWITNGDGSLAYCLWKVKQVRGPHPHMVIHVAAR